jgi:hypothetical protein
MSAEEKKENNGSTNDIFDLANHRRFSTRKRKNVDISYSDSLTIARPAKKQQQQQHHQRETNEIEFPLPVGTEIVINGKVKQNTSFSGEVLVVQGSGSNGIYKLEMANPCDGLWGNYIFRSKESLVRNIFVVKTPDVPLIPIEFSVLNAVYDIRSPSKSEKLPVESTLQDWRWVNSWARLTWTTQPLELSYQHIFNLAKAAIVDDFIPLQGLFLLSLVVSYPTPLS